MNNKAYWIVYTPSKRVLTLSHKSNADAWSKATYIVGKPLSELRRIQYTCVKISEPKNANSSTTIR